MATRQATRLSGRKTRSRGTAATAARIAIAGLPASWRLGFVALLLLQPLGILQSERERLEPPTLEDLLDRLLGRRPGQVVESEHRPAPGLEHRSDLFELVWVAGGEQDFGHGESPDR